MTIISIYNIWGRRRHCMPTLKVESYWWLDVLKFVWNLAQRSWFCCDLRLKSWSLCDILQVRSCHYRLPDTLLRIWSKPLAQKISVLTCPHCCLVEVEAVLGNRRDSQPVGHPYSAAAGWAFAWCHQGGLCCGFPLRLPDCSPCLSLLF